MNLSQRGSPYTSFLIAGFFLLLMIGLLILPTEIWEAANDSDAPFPAAVTQLLFAGGGGLGAAGFAIWGSIQLRDRRSAAAEPLTLSRDQLNRALQDALDFSAEDLNANRSGIFSPKQEVMLAQNYRRTRGCLWLYLVAIMLMCAGIALVGLANADQLNGLRRALETSRELLLSYALVGTLFMLVVIGGFLRGIRRNRPLSEQTPQSVEGTARLNIYHTRYGSGCQLRIGGERFYLSVEQGEGFWNGAVYRVYFIKAGANPLILTAEVLNTPLDTL